VTPRVFRVRKRRPRPRALGVAVSVLALVGVGLPVAVMAPAGAAVLGGVRSVSAGSDETCAVLLDTTARCWGYNSFGQVGDGTKTERLAPVVVQNGPGTGPLTNVAQIAVGTSHVCALLRDSSVRCWGEGGELGDGTSTTRARPVTVLTVAGRGPLRNATQISAGGGQTCVRMTDGTARCWGVNGALGNGRRASRLPVKVLNALGTGTLTHVAQISVGTMHTCVRIADGTARCWGYNNSGKLGDGTTTNHFLPVTVLNVARTAPQVRITRIVAGREHTCARITDGTARCWGFNGQGQLGVGTTTDHWGPAKVLNGQGTAPLQGVADLAVGGGHSCARIADGTVRCWGARGALGDANTGSTPADQLLPTKVMDSTGSQPLRNVTQVSTGVGHTCVLESDHTVRCFGENGEGELGDGTRTSRHFPVSVS
jgi:alpha-tubulin suppressor-like RCC1 family protein